MTQVVTYQHGAISGRAINLCAQHAPDGAAYDATYEALGIIGPVSAGLHAGTCDMCVRETALTDDDIRSAEALTDEQIETLRIEAGAAGDEAQVQLCRIAIGDTVSSGWERTRARAECARVIADAAAQEVR
jgi:hypothetical protein